MTGYLSSVPVPADARDYIGYGATPPDCLWPGGNRVACSVVLNIEEGAERAVARGDIADDVNADWGTYSVDPVVRNPLLESAFEYGSRAGIWRLLAILERHGVRATAFACGVALELNPPLAKALVARGHEIANHGYHWDEHALLSIDDERALLKRSTDALVGATGEQPRCWYSRDGVTPNSRQLLRDAGYTYDSNGFADDLPYPVNVGGKPYTVVPYTGDANDSGLLRVFPTGAAFGRYLGDTLEMLLDDTRPGAAVMTLGLHPRLVGRPAYALHLSRFLDLACARKGVWFATRGEIATAWQAMAGTA